MEYKEVQIFIERIAKKFCLKFDIFHLYEDLKSVGNLCYLKCKEKFKEGDFRKYFISALENELCKFLKREMRYENLKVDIEGIEEFYLESKEDFETELKIAKFIEDLNQKEKDILNLFTKNYSLREISDILGISYENVKDIWSEIKKKAGKIERSRKEVRKKWIEENKECIKEYLKEWKRKNPEYFKDWKSRNPEYFKEYFRIRRLIGKRGEIEEYLGDILEIFCLNEKEFKIEKKEKCLCFKCLVCSNSGCSSIISHTDFLEKYYMEKFDFIFLFSQLRALREAKGRKEDIRNKNSFVEKNLVFISENLLQNFNLIKSSGKRFFMLIKIKK